MKIVCAALTVAVVLVTWWPASSNDGSVEGDIRNLYERFVTAQNIRDLDGVRETLSSRDDFLWISDGKPFWGREAMITRMASFQKAELWKVEPEYDSAKVVQLSADSAYLHIPLVLLLGSKEKPAQLRWLVEVLCQKSNGRWLIAALFTAEDKRPLASNPK
jgi:uncharacterized protein (TIGR02246 family)